MNFRGLVEFAVLLLACAAWAWAFTVIAKVVGQ